MEPVEGRWALPDGWRWERLERIAPVNPKRTFDGIPVDADIAFVPMAAVEELTGQIDIAQTRKAEAVKSGFTKFRTGDLIFAKITPCMENGKLAIVPPLPHDAGAGSTEFHVVEPREVSGSWLFYYLSQAIFRQDAEHNMTGTAGQKRVPVDWLRNCPIPVPPSQEVEARTIARLEGLLDDIDDGEAALSEAQATTEIYRQSLLKAVVSGAFTAGWRADNPALADGQTLATRLLDERRARWEANPKNAKRKYVEPAAPVIDDRPLPPGWTWMSLDQLSWSSQYGTSIKCDVDGPGAPVLRIPNLRNGEITALNMKRASADLNVATQEFVAPGDLLIVRTNGSEQLIGRTGVVTQPLTEATYFASYLIRFRLIGDELLWEWVRAFTESALFRERVRENIGSSAGQYNLSMGKLDGFPIAVPPPKEMAAALSAMASARLPIPQIGGAHDLRSSILLAAFRGDLA